MVKKGYSKLIPEALEHFFEPLIEDFQLPSE